MGGAAQVSLDLYMPKGDFDPVAIDSTPLKSFITWARVGLFVLGIFLAFLEAKEPTTSIRKRAA